MKRLTWIAVAVAIAAYLQVAPSRTVQAQTTETAAETTAAVEDAAAGEDTSHYEHLKGLEWLLGEWVDDTEDVTITTKCGWSKNQNFISRTFRIVTRDDEVLEGIQVIGWDPIAKQVRSWMFDSEGGIGEGRWTQKENQWVVKVSQVLKGGRRASSINVFKRVDDSTFTWQSFGREIDGELLPDVPEITIARKPTE